MFTIGVSLPRPWDKIYNYTSTEKVQIGTIVQVDFGGKPLCGITRSCIDDIKNNLKPIISQKFILHKNIMLWLEIEAAYHFLPYGVFVALILRKTLAKFKIQEFKYNNTTLSNEQLHAAQELNGQINLLYGATGSGKTEIYFKIIEQALIMGGQVLVLLPEILLTKEWQSRFYKRFGVLPYLWHSKISQSKKDQIWSWALSGTTGVVVGARSAIFLPLNNLKLIVIDEEHDQSYKQDKTPRYHAREVAIRRALYAKAQVILVSATPSLESMNEAHKGNYKLVKLVHHISLPEVITHKLEVPVSQDLMNQITHNSSEGKGNLLLINRRGYASLASCASCKRRLMCGACSVHLSWHRDQLICHWCGRNICLPDKCSCGAEKSWKPIGWGLERVYDWIKQNYPNLRIGYVSSDTEKGALEELRTGTLDLVIGTQIISQGHHIPSIALVGIVDLPEVGDFRAPERLYQLIAQTRGRAGRDGTKSIAWWETDNPKNIVATLLDNPEEFYRRQLDARKKANMPPFSTLIAIIISAKENADAKKIAISIKGLLNNIKDIDIWGPSPAPLAKLKNKYRWRLLLRGNPSSLILQDIYKMNTKTIEIEIDRCPYHFY